MKRYPILYPFVFGINFVLTGLITGANITQIPLSQALRPLIVVLVGTGIMLCCLWWLFRDWSRAGFVTLLLLLLLLYYGPVYQLFAGLEVWDFALQRHAIVFGIWGLGLGVLGSSQVWKRITAPLIVTNLLNVVSVVLLVTTTYVIVRYVMLNYGEFRKYQEQQTGASEGTLQLSGEAQPDIYYIILDAYGRADILQDIYDFDNSEFLDYLRARAFYVADESQSNYMHTFLSLSSSLNLKYLNSSLAPLADCSLRPFLADSITHSEVRSALENHGYRIVAFASGSFHTEIRDADVYLSAHTDVLNEFETFLLSGSAFKILTDTWDLGIPISSYETHRERILYAFERLAEIPGAIPGPKFVFAHIIAPHPPFVFDSVGQPVQPDTSYFLGDADGYPGTDEEYLEGYAEEIPFINRLLETSIDAILTNSSTPPVIITQADHGPGAFLSWTSLEDSCLKERFSILNAYYLPQQQTDALYSSITPVNSFRVIFDTYFDTHLGLLEDRSYYSPWGKPYNFTDVTEASRAECSFPSQ